MTLHQRYAVWLVVALAVACSSVPARAAGVPAWLPRYDVTMDLDLERHEAKVQMRCTWTNPHPTPASELVFNAHSHYVVPSSSIPLMAKTLELLRVNPSDSLGDNEPACEVRSVALVSPADADGKGPLTNLPFRFAGDTNTSLVVPLPGLVGQNQSVTVVMDLVMRLPPKQGRWGQWRGVTFLSNWLPVFAVYGDVVGKAIDPPPGMEPEKPEPAPNAPPPYSRLWQPTPFIPWHQPFFNEAGVYQVRVTLPGDQKPACTGTIVADKLLPDGRRQLDIQGAGMRDFAFLCSAEYKEVSTVLDRQPGVAAPIRVHVLAKPEHEYYAKEMLRIACDALVAYGKWFGPYPFADYTIVESYFGWNGNECAGLVMIDERVFGLPHVAGGYVDYLISHETCHQWWYNVVGTNGYSETFMDEALATYFSHRLLNEKVGRNNKLMDYPKGLEWLPNVHREDYHSYGMYGTFARGENGPIIQDMEKFGHIVSLFSMCYDKGSRVVGMIEERMGSAAFLDCMRGIYSRYQYRILRVADFRRELETYSGYSWQEFFRDWLYGSGLSDWAVEEVTVQPPPSCCTAACGVSSWLARRRACKAGPNHLPDDASRTRVVVMLHQKAEINEQTVLGFALSGCEGYPIRVPILPQARSYHIDEPPASIEVLPDNRVRVEVLLPEEPTQIAVDPDQILIDKNPANNFWKTPFRWRITPVYTFLEETDLTNAYDRWNFIFGPWIYGPIYDDAWYTRSTMVGLRAGAYRTQEFDGGVYAGYRTDFRDMVVGVDGLWDHWPDAHFQTGFNYERRLTTFLRGDNEAMRGVAFSRYIFLYNSSLYMPPAHYVEGFTAFEQNFLPFPRHSPPTGERFDQTTTTGFHYRIDYLTPYWDPEGGFKFDVTYEGGVAELHDQHCINKMTAQFSTVAYLPDLTPALCGAPRAQEAARPALEWLAATRVAVRAYGATGLPTRGEFFTMGGDSLFRGFDQSEREGSTVWVGSVEWRVPLVKGLGVDAADHIVGLRNVYGALFYDVGDAYTSGHSVGPVAHAVGGGLRLDLAWFGFVERTMLRFDVAKTVNADTGYQFILGLQHPF